MGNRLVRRRFLRRALALGVSASAASSILAACGGGASSSSKPSSASTRPPTTTLTYRPSIDVQNMDPAFWVSQDDWIIFNCIYEGLVTFRPGTWELVNNLAESLRPSPTCLRYPFPLKNA